MAATCISSYCDPKRSSIRVVVVTKPARKVVS